VRNPSRKEFYMKRIFGACLVLAVALFLFGVLAYAAEKPAAASKTMTGEVVDLGCYLGSGMKGAGHKQCATTCITKGGPMGLLTSKGVLYVLTMNHDNADAFNEVKEYAGGQVKITGPVAMRSGTRSLQVDTIASM
jgi:hypothetical protein